MKALLLTICLLALAFTAHAADVTLTWDANTETDLAGYRVYQGNGGDLGTFTRVQDIAAPATTATVKGLDNTAHSFAVTAYNTAAYRLDNAGAQVRVWEAFTPSSSSYIVEITGAENAILNPELATETMMVTVRWTYGTGSTGSEAFEYVIKNLRCSP